MGEGREDGEDGQVSSPLPFPSAAASILDLSPPLSNLFRLKG